MVVDILLTSLSIMVAIMVVGEIVDFLIKRGRGH